MPYTGTTELWNKPQPIVVDGPANYNLTGGPVDGPLVRAPAGNLGPAYWRADLPVGVAANVGSGVLWPGEGVQLNLAATTGFAGGTGELVNTGFGPGSRTISFPVSPMVTFEINQTAQFATAYLAEVPGAVPWDEPFSTTICATGSVFSGGNYKVTLPLTGGAVVTPPSGLTVLTSLTPLYFEVTIGWAPVGAGLQYVVGWYPDSLGPALEPDSTDNKLGLATGYSSGGLTNGYGLDPAVAPTYGPGDVIGLVYNPGTNSFKAFKNGVPVSGNLAIGNNLGALFVARWVEMGEG